MLKMGILGMGMMGWTHAVRYPQIGHVALSAMADLDPERLEAKKRVQGNLTDGERPFDFESVARYPSADALLAHSDVEAVDICLPTYLHAEYAIKALESGRHVLCEKPMALTSSDADRMIAAAEHNGRQLMVAQCLRFWPEYRFLRETVTAQTYGQLLSLNMYRLSGRPGWASRSWFLDPALSGGALLDLHLHDVDYVNAVFGMPDDLSVVGRPSPDTGGYDVVHACFNYRNGPQIHIHGGWSMVQTPFMAGFDAWFERGFLRYAAGALTVYDSPSEIAPHPAPITPGDAYTAEIAYFGECAARNQPPTECLPRSTRDSVALIEQELQGMRK